MTKEQAEFINQFTQQTIYMMGICFMLGSLFTIFVLLILDMMRRVREEGKVEIDSDEAIDWKPDA